MKKIKKGIIPALVVLLNATWISTVAEQCSTNIDDIEQGDISIEDIKAALNKSTKEVSLSENQFKQIQLDFGTVLTTDVIRRLGMKNTLSPEILEKYNFRILKNLDSSEIEVSFTKDSKAFTLQLVPEKFSKFLTEREWKFEQLCSNLSSSIKIYYGSKDDFRNLIFQPRECTSDADLKKLRDDLFIDIDSAIFDKYENLKLTFSKAKTVPVFICDVNYDNMSRRVYLIIDKYLTPPWLAINQYYETVRKINYSFAKQQDFKMAEYDGDYAKFAETVHNKGLNVKLPDPAKDQITFHAKKAKNSLDVTYTIEKEWANKTFVVRFDTFKEQINNVDLNIEDIKKSKLISRLSWNSFKSKLVTESDSFSDALQKLRLDNLHYSIHIRPGVTLKAKKSNNSTEVTYQGSTGNYVKELKINYRLFKEDSDYADRIKKFLTDDKQRRSYTYNYERDFKNAEWKDTSRYFPKTIDAFHHLGLQQPYYKNNKFKIILTKNRGTTVVNYAIVSDVYNIDPRYDVLNEYKTTFNVQIIHFGVPGHF